MKGSKLLFDSSLKRVEVRNCFLEVVRRLRRDKHNIYIYIERKV